MKVLEKKENGLYDISYYDKITKQNVILNDVSEDVVKELRKHKREDDNYRKWYKRHFVSLELLEENGFNTDDYDEIEEDANPEFCMLEVERLSQKNKNLAQLGKNMRKLTPKQQEVVFLHFYKGMSLNEIAYALRIEYDSVIDRLNRAKDRLSKNIF